MKSDAIKTKFLEMRVTGHSYRDIAQQLGVSKQTLITWGKDYAEEIENLRTIELDALQRKYKLHAEGRVEIFGGLLDRLNTELKARDLSTVPTGKLIDYTLKIAGALQQKDGLALNLSATSTFTLEDVDAHLQSEIIGSSSNWSI